MQKLASPKKKITKTIIITLIFLLAPLTAFASASPTYMGGIENVCDLSLTDSQGDIYDEQDIEDFGQRSYGQLTRIIVVPETYTMDIDCVANLNSGTIDLTVFKVIDQDGISSYNSATDRIPTQASTFFVSSAASTLTLDATGALANRLLVNWEIDAEAINGDPVQQSGMLIIIPLNDTTNDTTPRISFWYGKVNQHNENGVWMTDSDGVSGGGTYAQWGSEGYGDRKLEYCQKFWPNTVSVELRTFNEEITFRNRGNSGSIDSIRDVYECVLGDDLGDDDASMSCMSSVLPIDGLVNIIDVNPVYNIGDQFDGYFDTCWVPSNNSMSLIAWLNNSNGINYDIQAWGGGNNWASMNLGVQQLGPYGHWGFPISEDGSTFGMNYSSLSLPFGDYCWEALLKVYDGNTYTPVDDDTACFTIQSNSTGGNNTGDDDNNTGGDNDTGDEDEQPYIPPTLEVELDTTTSPSLLSLTASNLDSSKDYTIEWFIVSTDTFDIVSGSEGIEDSTGLQITDTWVVTDEMELESGEYCLLGTLFEDGELVETEVIDCQTVVTPEVVEDDEVEANMVEKVVTAISELISGLLASIVEAKDE